MVFLYPLDLFMSFISLDPEMEIQGRVDPKLART